MKVAINGCCHGELDALYEMLQQLEEKENIKVDLLICCGDFQSLRSEADLQYFHAPPKYKKLKDFHLYFRGLKRAPRLTLLVGGNHEAPNVLRQLYYGGWLAPNIFFLGYSGVVNVGGIRIAGLSGIYDKRHYHLGHFEKPPYNESTSRSAYHVREFELLKLHCIEGHVDIMLSHDWPEGIYEYGDKQSLLKRKPLFKNDINNKCLGSPPSMALLKSMKPSFWFSGHLHVFFPAIYFHDKNLQTNFLALDKVLPGRSCLQVVDIHPKVPNKYLKRPSPQTNIQQTLTVEFDLEWLAILRANQNRIPLSAQRCSNSVVCPSEEDRLAVLRKLREMFGEKKEKTKNENEKNKTKETKEETKEEIKEEAKGEIKEIKRDMKEEINQITTKTYKDAKETNLEDREETKKNKNEKNEINKNEENPREEDKTNQINPPFQDFAKQRKVILNIIGAQDKDPFADNPEEPRILPKGPPLVRRVEEEISLDLDEL
ncbi:serine/threonine protein phosphatase, putative [Eimeria tenella]|uniref:Serine/threonine protein phosphatase, putative n=1 Tax=Eimeria tenella TaxID=5802 RepID=U6KPY8_EIMTE|nr:serine/threonine protein phosphatase, putative [Eimeria tenella]CDJ38968.1 serine/threonine protein phosphatase, putative [Eimeria tenella]|eukprot:XP_013229723.1 serine/threonine protein phosphatase, putative [Eimeria tenella]